MINREVTYERNLTGSFIRVPAAISGQFDEKIMLLTKIKGLIPVEKSYFNNAGQYWYNITGVQPLETYCKVHELDYMLIEKLLFRICEQVEVLEWHLMAPESMLFDPEYIFITNSTQDFAFMTYPGSEASGTNEVRKLLEYILTKINHKDETTVQYVYGLYDKVLRDDYLISDLKVELERLRNLRVTGDCDSEDINIETAYRKNSREKSERESINREVSISYNERQGYVDRSGTKQEDKKRTKSEVKKTKIENWKAERNEEKKESIFEVWKQEFLERLRESYKEILPKAPKRKVKEKEEEVYYPSMEEDDDFQYIDMGAQMMESDDEEIYPTVCIQLKPDTIEGTLRYEGADHLDDIHLGEYETKIGKGKGVQVSLDVDTISHLHARIYKEGNDFYIEDLNSTNGTFINDELLSFHEKKKLRRSDIVRFADVTYKVV